MTDDPPATPATTSADDVPADRTSPAASPLDLAAIERDLVAVEAALPRLDDGSYWVDEISGEPIPDEVHAVHPVARRV